MNRKMSPATRTGWAGRLLAGLLPALLLALAGGSVPRWAGAAPNDAITVTAPNNTTLAESDDYATQVLGQPWDMSTPDQFGYLEALTPPTVGNGVWSSTTTLPRAGNIHLLDQGYDTVNSYIGQRVGPNYPIDTQRFSHLRFRMYTSTADQGVIWWYNQANGVQGNSVIFTTFAGWHIYDVDLTQTGGAAGGRPWAAENWTGLRLDPQMTVNASGVNFQFDWVRLTPATGATVNITWTASGSSPVSLYLDSDTDAGNGTEYPIASGLAASAGSYGWRTSGLAPGTYYVRAVLSGASSYSGPLVINAAPVLNLTAPSPSSGEDFAQSHQAGPWTMTSLSQLQAWFNLTNIGFGANYLQAGSNAVSGGHADPQLWYLNNDNGHQIDTTRYHYLTYQMYIQAPNHVDNGQYPQMNLGPRVYWAQPGVSLQLDDAYMHYYNRWEPVALDLRTVMLAPGYNATGWTGQVSTFRIDPYEEHGAFGSNVLPQFFQLGNVRLTADPTVASGAATTISWVPSKNAGTVTLQYSTSRGGGTTFATVPLGQGGYVWTVNLPAGRYWITATAYDGLNIFSQIARAPLVVAGTRPCPLNFSDVPQSDVFYPFISDLACRNVIEGYSDNTFRTSSIATRATLAKWVVVARGWALDTTGGPHFSDVATNDPYYPYIETARLHSVLSGYSDGTFKPNNEVSRGQMSKMIVIGMGWTINAPTQHFSDVPTSYVFYPYVETLVAHSAVSGYNDGTFRPGNNLSRGQLAKVLSIAIRP